MFQVTECLHNLANGNALGKAILGTASNVVTHNTKTASAIPPVVPATVTPTTDAAAIGSVLFGAMPLWEFFDNHRIFVRIAGVSGAMALLMYGYGKNRLPSKQRSGMSYRLVKRARSAFATANNVHFCQSLVLLVVPYVKQPVITGTFLIIGTAIFSGVMYHRAFTSKKTLARYAPIGLTILVVGWMSIFI